MWWDHITTLHNWFKLVWSKIWRKKRVNVGFFQLKPIFCSTCFFSTYFHFIHHIPKVNFQILYCALHLGTSPHPEIQSHPSVQSNPLIAPRCYIHLRWRLCGRESLNNIGPGPSKIGASWIFPSLPPCTQSGWHNLRLVLTSRFDPKCWRQKCTQFSF